MSMQYVRDRYQVPAKRGRRVDAYLSDGRLAFRGVIASASGHVHLRPLSGGHSIGFHPTHQLVYYADDGETVLCDTRTTHCDMCGRRKPERPCEWAKNAVYDCPVASETQ